MPSFSAYQFRPQHPPATAQHGAGNAFTCLAGSLLLAEPDRCDELVGLYGVDVLFPLTAEQVEAVGGAVSPPGPFTTINDLAESPPDSRKAGKALRAVLGG